MEVNRLTRCSSRERPKCESVKVSRHRKHSTRVKSVPSHSGSVIRLNELIVWQRADISIESILSLSWQNRMKTAQSHWCPSGRTRLAQKVFFCLGFVCTHSSHTHTHTHTHTHCSWTSTTWLKWDLQGWYTNLILLCDLHVEFEMFGLA